MEDFTQFYLSLFGLAGVLIGMGASLACVLWLGVKLLEVVARSLQVYKEVLAWMRWRKVFHTWRTEILPLKLTNAPEQLIAERLLSVLHERRYSVRTEQALRDVLELTHPASARKLQDGASAAEVYEDLFHKESE